MHEKAQQLVNAGIIKKKSDLKPNAKKLINSMTDDEFHAVITSHAKCDSKPHREKIADTVQLHGF